MIYIGLTYN